MSNKALAKIAYDAYCEARDWKSVCGDALPHFDQQTPDLQEAWTQAAVAVAEAIRIQQAPG